MLDLLGAEYVIEHCVTVYSARQRQEAYQVYTTDCLSAIAKGLGAKVDKRYYDIIHPKPVDNRSAEEIVDDIVKKMGLKEVNASGYYESDSNAWAGQQ